MNSIYTPIISIIMPIYNGEKYLEIAINSVLEQSFTNFELLLINDGSSDNSKNICTQYAEKDNRIIYIEQKNSGIEKAVVNGISLSKGSYICFLDSDDWVQKNMYEVLVNKIKETNADLVQCGTLINGKTINKELTSDKELLLENLENNYIKPFFENSPTLYPITMARWNKIYKADILKKIALKIDTGLKIGEDLFLNLEYLKQCKSVFILKNENNHCYRENMNSVTKEYNINKQNSLIFLFEILKQYAINHNYQYNAIIIFKNDTLCSLMLEVLLSNISKNEKYNNLCFLYDELSTKKHIIKYAKNRPLLAKIVLFFIKIKAFKSIIFITNLKNN